MIKPATRLKTPVELLPGVSDLGDLAKKNPELSKQRSQIVQQIFVLTYSSILIQTFDDL